MCGRFTLRTPTPVLIEHFAVPSIPPLPPRYNIAPTQPVAIVRSAMSEPARQFAMVRWGLIPRWAKDPTIGSRLINARAETAAEKPSFRSAFRRRRCLVMADGFYEWQRRDGAKRPYFIERADGQPIGFAGLWERWHSPECPDEMIESCTILTTDANDALRPIHERMPVVLEPEAYDRWLDPVAVDPGRLTELLVPCAATLLTARPVSTYVNSPAHDDPHCLEAAPPST